MALRRLLGRPGLPQGMPARSAHSRETEMPRGCRPACHTGRAGGETDAARQTCARRPSGTGPGHSRASHDAQPARARCDAPVDRTGSLPHRHARSPSTRSGRRRSRPRSPLERRNRIDERQDFLRVVPVGSGQANGERHAAPVAITWFCSRAWPIGRIATSLLSAMNCPHRTTVDDGSRPMNLAVASPPIQHRKVHQIPRTRQLPVAQTSPARHPGPAAQFVWQHLPGDAAAKDKENAGQARSIGDARPAASRS
jgi:hypothetical protein